MKRGVWLIEQRYPDAWLAASGPFPTRADAVRKIRYFMRHGSLGTFRARRYVPTTAGKNIRTFVASQTKAIEASK